MFVKFPQYLIVQRTLYIFSVLILVLNGQNVYLSTAVGVNAGKSLSYIVLCFEHVHA